MIVAAVATAASAVPVLVPLTIVHESSALLLAKPLTLILIDKSL